MSEPEPSIEELLSARLSVTSLKIGGASRTNAKLLERIIHPVLSTGGTFSGVIEDVSQAVDRLRNTNCFKGVDAYLDTTPTGDASVVFTLQEKSLYQITTGTNIRTDGEREASIAGSFLFRNLTGTADTLKASLEWGGAGAALDHKPSASVDVQYQKPFFATLDTTAFGLLRVSENNHASTSSYSLYTRRAASGIHSPWGMFSLSSSWREVGDVDKEASCLIREDAGHSWITSLNHSIQYDNRDHSPMPTRGSAVELQTEIALPVGNSKGFTKLSGTAQNHFSIAGGTLSLCGRSGVMLSSVRANLADRFFLGGSNSFRGFQPRGVGPRDKNDALGGDIFYTLTSMFSLPLPKASLLSQMFNARMHAFATCGDMSEVKEVGERVAGLGIRQMGDVWQRVSVSARVSAGLGIALETSVGRIEINVCRVLRGGERDVPHMGVQFGLSEAFL